MIPSILIVSNSQDLHADCVADAIIAQGGQIFRLDLDAFPAEYAISQSHAYGRVHRAIRRSGQWLDLDAIGAVWVRKRADFTFVGDALGVQEKAFATQETEHALFSLLYSLDCYWMSHPRALRGAQWKGEQLERAARMGFKVPASIVSNCPSEVRRFQRALPGQMIFKTLSTPTLAADDVDATERVVNGLATTLVDDAMLADLDAVSIVPCHFQQYIDKQYELRVTVIGEQLFAARIASQDDARTRVDSRDMSADVAYTAVQLDAQLATRCRDFVHSYGLTYGALDLIVTPGGEVVFLENNPVGQFLYVQQLLPELNMVDAVAATLIAEARCRN